MKKQLKIATRKSPLALWQAKYIKTKLQAIHPNLSIDLVQMTTLGDRILDAPLAKIGGKGLFIKELEQGMLDGRANLAVHSMKDVPMLMPDGFKIGAICARATPFDAFVSNQYQNFDDLPKGMIVGTSSLRRQSQILAMRPDLQIKPLRGNVNTRLAKLDSGEFDAIILAAAGLVRLGMEKRINNEIPADIILPAVGQGAIGIETLASDSDALSLIAPLNCADTFDTLSAERSMNFTLEGGCQVPIAGFATLNGNTLFMNALVASPDGKRIIQRQIAGHRTDAVMLGKRLGRRLLLDGADEILRQIY